MAAGKLTGFSFEQVLSKAEGEAVNLTTLTLSAHTGSHADVPWHYDDNGPHPADVPLEKYIGPAHVVTVARRHGGLVPEDFAGHDLEGMQRLLLHTWVSDLPDEQWPEDFPYRHSCEGPDDMPGHVKSSLLGSSLTVPIRDGRLRLGTWQGICLCEHRQRAPQRRLVLTVEGDTDGRVV